MADTFTIDVDAEALLALMDRLPDLAELLAGLGRLLALLPAVGPGLRPLLVHALGELAERTAIKVAGRERHRLAVDQRGNEIALRVAVAHRLETGRNGRRCGSGSSL